MNNEEKIKMLFKNNNGYIRTNDLLNIGISKPIIQSFIEKGLIERVSHGIYMDAKLFKDEYYILQKKISFCYFFI